MTDYKTLYDAIVNLNIPIEKQGKFANDKDLWFEYAHFPYTGKSNQSDAVDLNIPLTFEAKTDGTIIHFCSLDHQYMSENIEKTREIEVSKDNGETWVSYTSAHYNEDDSIIAVLNEGEKILVRGDNPNGMGVDSDLRPGKGGSCGSFWIEGESYVYGNIMSLLSKENFASMSSVPKYAFACQFYGYNGNSNSENWKNNKSLFLHPTNKLVLPATTLDDYCYYRMFQYCSRFKYTPELPATVLAKKCYAVMFKDCGLLTNAPKLPAMTLAESCYDSMFQECYSLTTAPELPATTLADRCYQSMFYDSENLNYIKAMFITNPGDQYTLDWTEGVSSTGTFVKNPEATWDVTGTNGIPTGWTVETA